MERAYNRNKNSYRPHRNDSREDYQSGKKREENMGYGGRKDAHINRNKEEKRNSWNDKGRRSFHSFDHQEERQLSRSDRKSFPGEERSFAKPHGFNQERRSFSKSRTFHQEEKNEGKKRFFKKETPRHQEGISVEDKEKLKEKHYSKKKILAHRLKNQDQNTELRLNRFISMGGICSRRDADGLIVSGRVKVNGVVVQTVGQKVRFVDHVEVDGVQVFPEKKVYLVLNKPKDYVTTVEDPLERKTVMSLIEGACKERIYPVGRLDRQTTGVLLFTNDGDLAKKLTHPKYDHKKIYHVFLDKPLMEQDFNAVATGIELEDGFIKADEINYVSPDLTEVGIEIHSGKNRIVRRIFEHLGYQIIKLDRVYFAGITKKNLPRGTWRFLTPKEVNILKVY